MGPAPGGRFDGHRLQRARMAQLTLPQVSQSQLPLTPATGILGLFPIDASGPDNLSTNVTKCAQKQEGDGDSVTYSVSLEPARLLVGLVCPDYRQGVTAVRSH